MGHLPLSGMFSSVAIFLLFTAAVLLIVRKHHAGTPPYLVPLTLSISVATFILFCVYFYDFLVDDVYISLRYARNFAEGHGMVFSTDGSLPVEGYTNFLWVMIEVPLYMLGLTDLQVLHAIRIIGIIFGSVTIVAAYLLMRSLGVDRRTALIAPLFLAISPEFSFWAVGGLETGLYVGCLVVGVLFYVRERNSGGVHFGSSLILLLAALTRPEGLFFAFALWFYHIAEITVRRVKSLPAHASVKKLMPGVLVFLLLYAVYFFWRYNWFGYPFPNTFYAKKPGSAAQLFNRVKQLLGFVLPLLPFAGIAAASALLLVRKKQWPVWLLMFVTALLSAFCFLSRHEWMPGYRYEVPVLPFLLALFAVGAGTLFFHPAVTGTGEPKYLPVPGLLLFFFGMAMIIRSFELKKTGASFTSRLERAHVPLGHWLKKHAPENSSYASWDMGAVPYFSELPAIIDINSEGLLNPNTTHRGYDVDGMYAAKPSFLVLPPNSSYVRPPDILAFYRHPDLKKNYEHVFDVNFDRDYVLRVYKRKDIDLSPAAIREAVEISRSSKVNLEPTFN